MPEPVIMLGLESSCDDTAAAVLRDGRSILANVVSSQDQIHGPYGGVVPELASRDHVRKLLPLIHEALAEAGLRVQDLGGVAYTAGPGLVGALLVGASVGRALAWALGVPAVGVRSDDGLEAAVKRALDANGPTVIEAVVDSEHYTETVYD